MANRLYNKQVSPKGYKMGGRVKKMGGGMMKKRSMLKDGNLKPVDPKKQKGLSKLPRPSSLIVEPLAIYPGIAPHHGPFFLHALVVHQTSPSSFSAC